MATEPTDKKKAWPLSLNSSEVGEIEQLMTANKATDRTEFVLGSVRRLEALKPACPDLLVNLASIYHPAGRDELAASLSGALAVNPKLNQARLVAHFIDALVKALADPDFKGGAFELLDARKLAEWESVSEDRLEYIAHRVTDLQKKSGTGINPPTTPEVEADEAGQRGGVGKKARKKKRGA